MVGCSCMSGVVGFVYWVCWGGRVVVVFGMGGGSCFWDVGGVVNMGCEGGREYGMVAGS